MQKNHIPGNSLGLIHIDYYHLSSLMRLYLWHNGYLTCVHSIRIETTSLTENIHCVVVMKHTL